MILGQLSAAEAFGLFRYELLLFAASFLLIGLLDEFAVDICYLVLKITGKSRTPRLADDSLAQDGLAGPCAIFIPAWREQLVIAATVRHALSVWPHPDVRIYVGCYRNDAATLAAAMTGCAGDGRLRIVVHGADGPTCKADCLNRLYLALCEDEARAGLAARMVVLHDAEDMVDPLALPLLDAAIGHADFVQLPVLPLPRRESPLVGGHYSDEFAENHGKAMVVRSALGRGIPGAGVGCAIARPWLDRLDCLREGRGPFATGALTEDYELGLTMAALGAEARFLRVRSAAGRLIATRAYFPVTMRAAIRQKTRWLHGIAFQGWDRLGWRGSPAALWMQLRDRRGPFAALLLAAAYLLVVVSGIELVLRHAGLVSPMPLSPGLKALLWINLAGLVWRLASRMIFTTREFGLAQGLLALPRVVVSNTVAIIAARRAVVAYARSLRGEHVAWDKTDHDCHPAMIPTLAGERAA